MSTWSRPLEILYTVAPGNSQVVIPFDSTWWLQQLPAQRAALATSSAYLAPGPNRGALGRALVTGTIKVGNQAVTVLEQMLTGNAGTSADWETETTGTIAIAASGTQPIEWKPRGADWRLRIDAGATGPDTLIVRLSVAITTDFGT